VSVTIVGVIPLNPLLPLQMYLHHDTQAHVRRQLAAVVRDRGRRGQRTAAAWTCTLQGLQFQQICERYLHRTHLDTLPLTAV
jgi:hypothetical protein